MNVYIKLYLCICLINRQKALIPKRSLCTAVLNGYRVLPLYLTWLYNIYISYICTYILSLYTASSILKYLKFPTSSTSLKKTVQVFFPVKSPTIIVASVP